MWKTLQKCEASQNPEAAVIRVQAASDRLTREARLMDLPEAAPVEYDEDYYRHTLAGGVLTTTRRQLTEMGRPDLVPRITDEAVQVREDLGWPIVVTPFAQYIVAQATLNLVTGERYGRLSDEIVDLLLGEFGPMPGPVNQDLQDRAMASPRAKQRKPREEPTLAEVRARFDAGLSDEDLLLCAVMPAEQVDAMVVRRGRADGGMAALLAQLSDQDRPWTSCSTTRASAIRCRHFCTNMRPRTGRRSSKST